MVARAPASTVVALVLLAAALAGCVSPAATEPSNVTDLRVAQVPEGARLTWDEFPLGVAKTYNIYRDDVKIGNVSAPLRTFLDRHVEPGKAYAYSVSAVSSLDREGPRAREVSFTFVRTLTFIQDGLVNRGYVNLTVLTASPGVKWPDLRITVGERALALDDAAYIAARESWTHSTPRDDLVDIGEKLRVYAPTTAKRNATVDITLTDGATLYRELLKGRPTMNLTAKQERNVTAGVVSIQVLGIQWRDGARDVSASHKGLVPRWSALEVRVNGSVVPYSPDNRVGTWTHDVPADDVLRVGGRLSIRTSIVEPGAVVVLRDAEMLEESFRLTLK